MSNVNATNGNSPVPMNDITPAEKGDSKDVTNNTVKKLEDLKEMLEQLTKMISFLNMLDQVFKKADADAKDADKANANAVKSTASQSAHGLKDISLAIGGLIAMMAGAISHAMSAGAGSGASGK